MKRILGMMIGLTAVTLVLAGTTGCGPEQYKAKTGGSEEAQKKVESGQPLYTPPPDAMPKTNPGFGGTMPGTPPR